VNDHSEGKGYDPAHGDVPLGQAEDPENRPFPGEGYDIQIIHKRRVGNVQVLLCLQTQALV
jgi:hypothetical protein